MDVFQIAKADLTRGNYADALDKFREFIRRYPGETELAANAQYSIALAIEGSARSQIKAGQHDEGRQSLARALQEFRQVVSNYPKSQWAPKAVYKETLILRSDLKQPAQARARLQYLIDNFPGSSEAKLATEQLKSLP